MASLEAVPGKEAVHIFLSKRLQNPTHGRWLSRLCFKISNKSSLLFWLLVTTVMGYFCCHLKILVNDRSKCSLS